MRLISLEITNFRVIKQAKIEFSNHVIGISGVNGAGKTSIIEAISWALYGNPVARSSKDEIRSSFAGASDNCQVILRFEIKGINYHIKRTLIGKSQRPELELFRADRAESFGSKETQKEIVSLLGMDWRGFLTSFLARQQELNALADLPPAQRREQMAGMMGIGRLDRALQLAKDDRKHFKQKIENLEKQMERDELVSSRLKELSEHAQELKQQHDKHSGAFEAIKLKSTELEVIFREHQEKKAKCSQLEVALNGNSQTIDHLTSQHRSWSDQKERLIKAELKLDELKKEIKPLPAINEKFEALVEIKSQITKRDELTRYFKEYQIEIDKANLSISTLTQDFEQLGIKLKSFPENLKELIEKISASLDNQRSVWTERRAETKHLELEISKIKAQLKATSEIDPKTACDRCGRPYGSDLEEIRNHLNVEFDDLSQKLKESLKIQNSSELEGTKLKQNLNQLENNQKEQNEHLIKIETVSAKLNSIKEQFEITNQKRDKIKIEIDSYGKLTFDINKWNDLKAKIEQLEILAREATALQGQIKELPETIKSINKATEQLEQLKSEKAKLEKQLNEIGFNQTKFDEITKDFNQAQEKLQTELEMLNKVSSEIKVLENEEKILSEEQSRLNEIAKELEDKRDRHFYIEKLITLFSDFRKHTISLIRPRLAHLSSQIMSEMSGGKYSFVELDEEYNLRVLDNGEYFGIERFSGGEKDLASLCLRLSISLALTESAGLEQSFIILDEVFSSQDSARRDLIFQALARLKERFPQMLLITHLEELKQKVERLIELRPTQAGWSEVIIDGQKV